MLASVTFDIPEELALRLDPVRDQLSHILELGLRELSATAQSGFEGTAEVLEFLASLPEPKEIIALRPSPALQARMSELLEKNRTIGLTPEEQQEWEHYQYLEHLVRLAKAKAYAKLNKS
jgi:hypothetical protein